MLNLLRRFMPPVTGWRVTLYEHEGPVYRFKADVFLSDGSILRVKEYLFSDHSRKYAYHWEDAARNLLLRWDNAEHGEEISTYPHHKHVGSDRTVQPSDQTDLESVLLEIRGRIT